MSSYQWLYPGPSEALHAAPTDVSAPPLSPILSDSLFSTVSVSSDGALTAVNPDLVCEFEKLNYYIGLCANDENVPFPRE